MKELCNKQDKFIDEMFLKYDIQKWIGENREFSWYEKKDSFESFTREEKRILYLNYVCRKPGGKLTFNQLAGALNKNHKLINRYAHYGNPFYEDGSKGTEEEWFRIVDYLMVLEGEKARVYEEEFVSQLDFNIMGNQVVEEVYYIDDGWDEKDDYAECVISNDEFVTTDKCSDIAASYIRNNLDVFKKLTPMEVQFIRWCRELENSQDLEKVVQHMEKYPVSLDIIRADGRVENNGDTLGIFRPSFHIVGVTNSFRTVCEKSRDYEALLRSYLDISGEEYEAKSEEMNLALSLSVEEWYCLYLLSRIQIVDYLEWKHNKIHRILGEVGIMNHEFSVYELMMELLGKK